MLMKKKLFIGIGIPVILIAVLVSVLIFTFSCFDTISVNAVADHRYGTQPQGFTYQLYHKRILQTGDENIFKVIIHKNDLFAKIKNDFEIYDESENEIRIIYNNEIYSIKVMEENILSTIYALYSNQFIYNYGEQSFYVPFPVSLINYEGDGIPRVGSEFQLLGSIDNIKDFYKCYKDVEIDGNVFSYYNIKLIVENDTVKVEV